MNNPLVRRGCIAAAIFLAVVLFIGADQADQAPHFPPPWDKVVHFLYYGSMAALLAHGAGRRFLWLPLALVPLIGIADEWHQFYVPGRDSSVYDWAADVLGTVGFVFAYYWGGED